MSELKYPKNLYHPFKPSFICYSEEFLNSLEDKDEWSDLPFTGDRKINISKCNSCNKLKITNKNLEIIVEELKDKVEHLKLEVDRLRIALQISENKHINTSNKSTIVTNKIDRRFKANKSK